jgi:hypothetical protein
MGFHLPANLRSRVRTHMAPGDVLHPIATKPARAKKFTGPTSQEKAWNREMQKLPGLFLPIRVVSLVNRRGNVFKDAERAEAQRAGTCMALLARYLYLQWPKFPVRVTLTRYGVRAMDSHDNLRIAFKHVVDGVADALNVNDADPRVEWAYAPQVKAKWYGIRILIEQRAS